MRHTEYRNEWKHEISRLDAMILRQRLKAVMKTDPHAGEDGRYHIRSLYFDTPNDKALREKIDGVSRREKYRMRMYNGNTSLIHMEKKSKLGLGGKKDQCAVTKDEARSIIANDIGWMNGDRRELLNELYEKMESEILRPKTIVDYTREPFIFPAGNVRVTIDYDIRTGLSSTDFLNSKSITIPATDAIILEVKWDEFLPSIIRDIVQMDSRRTSAFSKYQQCRIYG